jgi:hypothetical protein
MALAFLENSCRWKKASRMLSTLRTGEIGGCNFAKRFRISADFFVFGKETAHFCG